MQIKKWLEFKKLLDIDPDCKDKVVYYEDNSFYLAHLKINKLEFDISIPKDGSNEVLDWETNYKPFANSTYLDKVRISDGTNTAGILGDRLKVDAQISAVGQPSDNPGCPTISNKLRFDFSDTEILVTNAGYTPIYQYSGSGKLFSINLEHGSKDIILKLTIDTTEIIFELDLKKIDKLKLEKDKGFNEMIGTHSDNFSFKPHCPLVYNSSILLEAIAISSDKTIKSQLVTLTKET